MFQSKHAKVEFYFRPHEVIESRRPSLARVEREEPECPSVAHGAVGLFARCSAAGARAPNRPEGEAGSGCGTGAPSVPAARFPHRLRPLTRPAPLPRLCQVLQDMADDFVENLTAFACELASHRGGTVLEARDIQLALGAPSQQMLPSSAQRTTLTHRARLASQRRTGTCGWWAWGITWGR